MKANELRIGNLINRGGQQVTVGWGTLKAAYEQLHIGEPIPLTEEWLIRFGFEVSEIKREFGHKTIAWTHTGKYALTVYFKNGILSVRFWQGNEKRYVHQLQNLYFALTGEELTIKE